MKWFHKFLYVWCFQCILPFASFIAFAINGFDNADMILLALGSMIYGSLQEYHLGIAESEDDCPEPDDHPEDDLLGDDEPSSAGVSEQ